MSTNIYQKIQRERSSLEYESNAERGSIERARTSMGGENHGGRHPLKTMLRDSTISSSLHEGSIISQVDSKVMNPLKNAQLKHSIVIPTNFLNKKSLGAKTSYNVSMSTILQKNQLGGASIEDIIAEDATGVSGHISASLLSKEARTASTA
jgi:hypothetical protein